MNAVISNKKNNINNMNGEIPIPVDNINICILGCVSAGKSTILNCMFSQDYSQSKIKRTTMLPTAFVESETSFKSQEEISEEISSKNTEIIKNTESGQSLKLSSYGNQLIFEVEKLDIEISKKFNVTIFDMPGLNDARTKTQYFNYLKTNFHLFNIIIFVVNIESGLNTSDEMDILNLIAEQIEKNKPIKTIRMLTVANKADEMQLNSKTGLPEIVSAELKEMFDQIENTIEQVFRKKDIIDHLIGTVPICGIDAHLFRMIKSKGSKYVLNATQTQRIGISEMGNRFRAKTPSEQTKIVSRVLADKLFIDEMIKLSGFNRIDSMLANCILKDASSMVTKNIFQELKKYPTFTIDNIETSLYPIINLYQKLKVIDMKEYDSLMKEIVKNIHDQIYKKIINNLDVNIVIDTYNTVMENICSGDRKFYKTRSAHCTYREIFNKFMEFDKYPKYLIDKVMSLIQNEFNQQQINISKLDYFVTIKKLGNFSKEIIEDLLEKIMSNPHKSNTFIFDVDKELNIKTLKIFEEIKMAKNFMNFLRFFIRNKIEKCTAEQLIYKLFLYNKFGEIPIQNYINLKFSKIYDVTAHGKCFDNGCPETIEEFDETYLYDLYYIKLAQQNNLSQFRISTI